MSDAVQARYEALADQHPGEVGILGESINEHGTPVSVLRCAECQTVISICPPTTTEKWGDSCLAEGCPSYDVTRDVEIFFEPLADHGLIRRKDSDDEKSAP